jgi:hypothetical protein
VNTGSTVQPSIKCCDVERNDRKGKWEGSNSKNGGRGDEGLKEWEWMLME